MYPRVAQKQGRISIHFTKLIGRSMLQPLVHASLLDLCRLLVSAKTTDMMYIDAQQEGDRCRESVRLEC